MIEKVHDEEDGHHPVIELSKKRLLYVGVDPGDIFVLVLFLIGNLNHVNIASLCRGSHGDFILFSVEEKGGKSRLD